MRKLNIWLTIALIGALVTGITQGLVTYLASDHAGEPVNSWFTYYVVWIVFAVLGLIQQRNSE